MILHQQSQEIPAYTQLGISFVCNQFYVFQYKSSDQEGQEG